MKTSMTQDFRMMKVASQSTGEKKSNRGRVQESEWKIRTITEDADLLSDFQHLTILARSHKRKLDVLDDEDHTPQAMVSV